MIWSVKKKHVLILSICFLVLFFLIFWLYHHYYAPLELKEEVKAETLKKEQAYTNKLKIESEGKEVTAKDAYNLQKTIPIDVNLQDILLSIEKAELKANITIVDMAFGKDEILKKQREKNQSLEEYERWNEHKREVGNMPLHMPDNLKGQSIEVTFEASTYEEALGFLNEFNKSERGVAIEGLSIQPAKSEENVEPSDEETESTTEQLPQYVLSFTVFYYPSLTNMPTKPSELSTPDGEGKTTPFKNE
ncbi:hypothetical protein [Priestia filamentosa]|uniref:hypothetical protein n=1 Tax=Priestia filamentosa TaxID=1402861 RepID=UPI001C1E7F05|nr:hypothetical protein [Priestia filamentosa]